MAAFSLAEDSPEDISCICGLVDPEIEGILLRYDDEDRKDIEREMTNECDKQMLLLTRGKIFELVKAKVVRCISSKEAARLFGDAPTDDADERAALLSRHVNLWQLTPRRVEHKMSHDIMEMLAFILGSNVSFPSKLIKESSMGKGSIPDTSSCTSDADLTKQLEEDISNISGPATVEVISDKEGATIHSVSFSVAPKEGAQVEPARSEPVSTAHPSDKKSSTDSNAADSVVPPKCNCDCHAKRVVQNKGVNTVAVVTKAGKHDMATQTGEELITRTEFDYQNEYVEDKCKDNAKDLKEIMKWRGTVQDRLRFLEVAHKKEITELKKQQRVMSDAIGELEKRKVESAKPERDNSCIDIVDSVAGDDDGDSVWDIPMEQLTPPAKVDKAKAPKEPSRPVSQQMQTRSSKGANKQSDPQSSSAGKSASYKVGIEIVEESDPSTDSSSNTDGSAPDPKRMKFNEDKAKAGRRGGRRGRGRGRGSAKAPQVATIREEPAVGRKNKNDDSEDWSDMDDGSYYESLEDEAASDGDEDTEASNKEPTVSKNNPSKNKTGSAGSGEPKTTAAPTGQASNTRKDSVTTEQEDDSGSDRSSYAQMAGEEPWLTNDRKRKNVGNKFKSLKGVKATVHREVYVQGLDLQGSTDHSEMEKLVHNYCKKNGVKVVFLNIIPVKYDKSQVGCKLSVLNEDFERVLDDDFWPEFVTVRAWRYKNRDGPNPGAREGQGF